MGRVRRRGDRSRPTADPTPEQIARLSALFDYTPARDRGARTDQRPRQETTPVVRRSTGGIVKLSNQTRI